MNKPQVSTRQSGRTLAGSECWYLDAVNEMQNKYGIWIDAGDQVAGFFPSEAEAKEFAAKNGWEVVE